MARGRGILTTQFNLEVWRCRCGCETPDEVVRELVLTHAHWIGVRTELRDQLQDDTIEIYLTSGYRCRKYNATRPGASPNSLHVDGKAGDGKPRGASVAQLHQAARVRRGDADGRPKLSSGIGRYDSFVHLDRGRTRDWDGRKAAA